MSKPVKPGASEAAEYVLGLLGKEDSRAFAQRLKSDEALRAQVEYWESMFSSLPGEEAEPPPAGMFEKILDRIEGEGADLPGTLTKRESRANWFEISPGIKGRLLHVDRAQNRQYLLIRMAPGASYHPHSHDAGRTVAGAGRRPLVRRSQPEGRRLPRRDAVILASAGAHREWLSRARHHEPRSALERFRAKWTPVRVQKTRQNKNLEPGSDSIRTEKALAWSHEHA